MLRIVILFGFMLFSALTQLSSSLETTEHVRKTAQGAVWILEDQNCTEAHRQTNIKELENDDIG